MRLVPEHIYEKFSEEGDPIRNMGIGSKWVRLKPGENIIRPKKLMYMNNVVGQNHVRTDGCQLDLDINDDFKYRVNIDYHSIVMMVKNKKNGNLYIEAIPLGSKDRCESYVKTGVIKYHLWKKEYDWFYKEAPISFWEDYFDVV
jgi:hypothetical protein